MSAQDTYNLLTNTNEIQTIESQLIAKLLDILLLSSFTFSVSDGEETTLKRSRDKQAIMGALRTTDEDFLTIHNAEGKRLGSISFVYGNDGWDVINDYSASLSDILDPFIEEFCKF